MATGVLCADVASATSGIRAHDIYNCTAFLDLSRKKRVAQAQFVRVEQQGESPELREHADAYFELLTQSTVRSIM
jgi:hypothetical protein